MDTEKRIVKMSDGSEKEINIIISFKYEENNKNYVLYTFNGSDDTFLSSFEIVDDVLLLNEVSDEEANEINKLIKEKMLGGNE